MPPMGFEPKISQPKKNCTRSRFHSRLCEFVFSNTICVLLFCLAPKVEIWKCIQLRTVTIDDSCISARSSDLLDRFFMYLFTKHIIMFCNVYVTLLLNIWIKLQIGFTFESFDITIWTINNFNERIYISLYNLLSSYK